MRTRHSTPNADFEEQTSRRSARALAEQAFSRAAGAQLLAGDRVRLLINAAQNYPAWLAAIASARHHVHFESYIIHEDRAGMEFADALIHDIRDFRAEECGRLSSPQALRSAIYEAASTLTEDFLKLAGEGELGDGLRDIQRPYTSEDALAELEGPPAKKKSAITVLIMALAILLFFVFIAFS